MTETYNNLWITPLDHFGNKGTCNYWYTVANSFAHNAFNRPENLMLWLEERGLALASELPEHKVGGSSIRVTGSYRQQSHTSYDEFYSLSDVVLDSKTWSNGRITLCRITLDADGIRTEHTLNPNCKYRPEFDYREDPDWQAKRDNL
jgi:hypothetical protein